MKRKNEIKRKIWTIIVIGKRGRTREFKVRKPLVFLCFILLGLLIYGGVEYFRYMEQKIQGGQRIERQKEAIIQELKEINAQKESELKGLKVKAKDIEEKMRQLEALENELKNLIDENPRANLALPTFRMGRAPLLRKEAFLDSDQYTVEDMAALQEMIVDKSANLKELKQKVEKKFAYLECKPNQMPAKGKITSPFGYRKNPFRKGLEFHNGIDIGGKRGSAILAAGSGIVTTAMYKAGFGNIVIINHGYGYQSVYAHNTKIFVEKGQEVKKGERIASMGNTGRSTGVHLHFEVRVAGKPVNPMDVINNYD